MPRRFKVDPIRGLETDSEYDTRSDHAVVGSPGPMPNNTEYRSSHRPGLAAQLERERQPGASTTRRRDRLRPSNDPTTYLNPDAQNFPPMQPVPQAQVYPPVQGEIPTYHIPVYRTREQLYHPTPMEASQTARSLELSQQEQRSASPVAPYPDIAPPNEPVPDQVYGQEPVQWGRGSQALDSDMLPEAQPTSEQIPIPEANTSVPRSRNSGTNTGSRTSKPGRLHSQSNRSPNAQPQDHGKNTRLRSHKSSRSHSKPNQKTISEAQDSSANTNSLPQQQPRPRGPMTQNTEPGVYQEHPLQSCNWR
ncbi:hypothetical protein FHETE_2531 [Fusarium heterosporum]|uniref:Uncharacterized protein n=1 Tax=Fusarium heterosporum TaxID=42747 RepID=A0A8H5TNM6_FUSHE|nr:hypothetical protein FHETE_2531 [Fusarium heterosporum]